MNLPFGYKSITDYDSAYFYYDGEEVIVDQVITARWHPSLGFLSAFSAITLLIASLIRSYNDN